MHLDALLLVKLVSLSSLTDYRVFQEKTTSWCPDREEHGYYLTPLFRCSTNPRVITAHRWNVFDIDAELNKSSGNLRTLCLY